MTKAKNAVVVDMFINGNDDYQGSNLKSVDGKLINYTTVIALRQPEGIFLNGDKYSPTTSVHQNRIRNAMKEGRITHYIETTEKGINDIIADRVTHEPMYKVTKDSHKAY